MSSTTLPSAPLYTKDALNQDIADLLAIIPEVEPFTYLVPMRVDPKLGTAAMSRKELIFGEAFMDKLTPAERKGVILHEIWHAALCHATDDYPIELGDHRLRNMAMDIVINQKIKDYASRGYSIELPTYEGMYNPPLGYRPEDAAYEGMSWCEVYEILKLTAPEDRNKVIYATFDEHEHECSPGEGGMTNMPNGANGATIVVLKRNAKAAMDAHDSIKAGQSPLTSAGTEHGDGINVFGGTPARVSWQDKLRDVLVSTCVRGGVSWQKIDRRAFAMSHGETYQASRIQYEPSLPKTRILLDTSGSMCDIIGSAIKDIANILRSLNCMNVEILLYDTQVCDTIVLVDNGHVVDDPADWTSVSGGGGTNVRDALVSLQMTNDLTMVITDGQDELTAFDLAVRPAVWIVYGNNSGDTGVTIHIKEEEH